MKDHIQGRNYKYFVDETYFDDEYINVLWRVYMIFLALALSVGVDL